MDFFLIIRLESKKMKIKFKLLIILSVLLTIFIFCETNCPIIDKNINKQQSLSSVSKYLANIS